MHQHNHTLALRALDLPLEFFADDARWMRGHYHDGDRRRCLMGALDHLQQNHHIPYAGAVYFLEQALPSRQWGSSTSMTAFARASQSCARSS